MRRAGSFRSFTSSFGPVFLVVSKFYVNARFHMADGLRHLGELRLSRLRLTVGCCILGRTLADFGILPGTNDAQGTHPRCHQRCVQPGRQPDRQCGRGQEREGAEREAKQ